LNESIIGNLSAILFPPIIHKIFLFGHTRFFIQDISFSIRCPYPIILLNFVSYCLIPLILKCFL